MRFFADENISERLVRILDIFDADNEVEHLVDHFEKGIIDTCWIRAVSQLNPVPIVLSGDGRILKNPVHKAVLKNTGLSFVYLADRWTNYPWVDMVSKAIKAWPDLVAKVARAHRPTIFRVTANAKVEKLQLLEDLRV